MIVKTLHIRERKRKELFEIYPNQRDFHFRVDKKIEKDVKKGMVSRYSKQQILYITDVITDCENEEQYTTKIRKIESVDSEKFVFVTEEELLKREQTRIKQTEKIKRKKDKKLPVSVFKGTLLMMKNKKIS